MTKKVMLIYVSSTGNGKGGNQGNNNKFYYVELTESDDVITRYGRVGDTGTTLTKSGLGLRGFEKLVKSKKPTKKEKEHLFTILRGVYVRCDFVNKGMDSKSTVEKKEQEIKALLGL